MLLWLNSERAIYFILSDFELRYIQLKSQNHNAFRYNNNDNKPLFIHSIT